MIYWCTMAHEVNILRFRLQFHFQANPSKAQLIISTVEITCYLWHSCLGVFECIWFGVFYALILAIGISLKIYAGNQPCFANGLLLAVLLCSKWQAFCKKTINHMLKLFIYTHTHTHTYIYIGDKNCPALVLIHTWWFEQTVR